MATLTAPLDFDPFSPEFQRQDPFEVYRWLRDEAPVFYSEKWNWWALSRFEDVRAAALDPATYLSFEGIDIDDTAKDQSGPGFLPDIDNPRHDQIRRVIQPLLPAAADRRAEAERAAGGPRARRRLADRGAVDLARSWPGRCPTRCSSEVLGLPYAEDRRARGQLKRWVHELKDREPDDIRLTPVAKAATARHPGLLRRAAQRAPPPRPATTWSRHLVQADIDGMPFADEDIKPASEIMGLMMVLFLGGVESTAGLTGTLFKLLAENPDQRDLLLRGPRR